MNGARKGLSKLPTLFNKPTITTSTNLNEQSAKATGRVQPTTRNYLRRSKSFADIPPPTLNRLAHLPTSARKPLKRPGISHLETKTETIKKVKTTEDSQNIVPKTTNRPKAAPYDFKTKFGYVKEDYDKLKIVHRDLKEKYVEVTDQNEELLTKIEKLQSDLTSVSNQYKVTQDKLQKITCTHETIVESNKNLQTENNRLHTDLKETSEILKEKSNKLTQSTSLTEEIQSRFEETSKDLELIKSLNETMQNQLIQFDKKQRETHNIIQELKGNIRVFCRVRPQLEDEKHKFIYDINYIDEKTMEIVKNEKKSEFSFDKIFGPNSVQEDIFEELSQLVQSALDGYNVCIFAYGQTGSGKTYTMDGIRNSKQIGMIPRSIELIFIVIEELRKLGWEYSVKTSFLEIYNENIVDLLEPKKTHLDIRMVDSKSNDVYVTNLSITDVKNADELKYHMRIAQNNRATTATENNERSSRSHAVVKIILEGANKNRNEKCSGSLNLVDLAGSEKFFTNETTRLRETTNINKSLANLSNVILSLVKKAGHVPYRNSKLTHLLMPCLGGNSKTLMLVNISPLEDCFQESINSLRFARTVNTCKTGSITKMKRQQY